MSFHCYCLLLIHLLLVDRALMGAQKGQYFLSSFTTSLLHDFMTLLIRETPSTFWCVFVTGMGYCTVPSNVRNAPVFSWWALLLVNNCNV